MPDDASPHVYVTCERPVTISASTGSIPALRSPQYSCGVTPRIGLRGISLTHHTKPHFHTSLPSSPPWPITTTGTPQVGELSKYVDSSCTLISRPLNTAFSFNWEPHRSLAINHYLHVRMPHFWKFERRGSQISHRDGTRLLLRPCHGW